jgi:hypothetical protein
VKRLSGIKLYRDIHKKPALTINIQGVSGGIVNILGSGSMDSSE